MNKAIKKFRRGKANKMLGEQVESKGAVYTKICIGDTRDLLIVNIKYKIGTSLQLIRAIYRQFCCWHFRQTAARNVRHSVQISCNFRRNVQSAGKRDVLVTLTPPPPPYLT